MRRRPPAKRHRLSSRLGTSIYIYIYIREADVDVVAVGEATNGVWDMGNVIGAANEATSERLTLVSSQLAKRLLVCGTWAT